MKCRAQAQLPQRLRGRRRRAVRGRAGFSLVEAMVSAGIVGMMLVASLNLLGSAARTRAADNNRRTAMMLAQHLISEVQQQAYKDDSLLNVLFGPELNETSRLLFDDVDDYKDYKEKPPLDRNGDTMPQYAAWQRQVNVKWMDPDGLEESLTDKGLIMIEVTVTDPRGVNRSVYALRAERAVPADPPTAGSTWVNWTEVELQTGGDAPRHALTGVQNQATPPTPGS